jgi:hypothetical protein
MLLILHGVSKAGGRSIVGVDPEIRSTRVKFPEEIRGGRA